MDDRPIIPLDYHSPEKRKRSFGWEAAMLGVIGICSFAAWRPSPPPAVYPGGTLPRFHRDGPPTTKQLREILPEAFPPAAPASRPFDQ